MSESQENTEDDRGPDERIQEEVPDESPAHEVPEKGRKPYRGSNTPPSEGGGFRGTNTPEESGSSGGSGDREGGSSGDNVDGDF
jgi:hypothetical protein